MPRQRSDAPAERPEYDERAETLLSWADLAATAASGSIAKKFPVAYDIPPGRWHSVVTVGLVYVALSQIRLEPIPQGQKERLLNRVFASLEGWDAQANVALEDCRSRVAHLYNAIKDRPEYRSADHLAAWDALGMWLFTNLFGNMPETPEDFSLTRALGGLLGVTFNNWWRPKT